MKVSIETGSLNEILGWMNKFKAVIKTEKLEYLSAQAIVERTT
jgi:hypothetical protein